MPEVDIVKLKIRRGTDAQRAITVLEQGELGYTNDYKRLWVGDGQASGGTIVGNIVHESGLDRTTISTAAKGDVVYDNNKLYRLATNNPSLANDWEFIGTQIDTNLFEYGASNILTIKDGAITTTQIDSGIIAQNDILNYSVANGISVNIDNVTLENSSGTLKVKDDSIDQTQIKSTTFSTGLTGGSGSVVELDVNSSYFTFLGNTLSLDAIPAGSVNVGSLSSVFLGNGLRLTTEGDKVETELSLANLQYPLLSAEGIDQAVLITLEELFGGVQDTRPFDTITFDNWGRVTGTQAGVTAQTSLCADDTTTTVLSGGIEVPYLSGAYNGFLNQTDYTDQTIIDTLSTIGNDTYIVSLTSAGFIQIDLGVNGKIAIPAFRPPQ